MARLINSFHPIGAQLIVKYALKPISLLSERNVQLLKASLEYASYLETEV